MFTDADATGKSAALSVTQDHTDNWATQKAEMMKDAKSDEARAAKDSQFGTEAVWRSELYRLSSALQTSVPPDAQARFDTLVQQMKAQMDSAARDYKALQENPSNPAAQRNFFNSMIEAARVQSRGYRLVSMRDSLDPDGRNDSLGWVFTVDQMESVDRIKPMSGMESDSGPGDEKYLLRASDVGGKQYVSITVAKKTLEQTAEHLQKSLRTYYHDRRLVLKIDASAKGRAFNGVAEGKSVSELLSSVALRTGSTLVSDDKDPHTFILK
jgi:hypothetical protein